MKILFVENRYKTALWEKIAHEFIKNGHEVHWIIQNKLFSPKIGIKHIIKYPSINEKVKKNYTPEIIKIIRSDRGLNYFKIKSDNFIFYYEDKINSLIDSIKPNLVFGESTLFHELLVIEKCKKENILYLHPCTSRYPTNRFSFYRYNTLEPFGESGDQFTQEDALNVIESIAKRKKLPDYMQKSNYQISLRRKIIDKMIITCGYYLGEKFNTPSPITKLMVTKKYNKNIIEWERIAINISEIPNKFCVLYPLQMQPEANIDVWGNEFNNQAKVVEKIVSQLDVDDILILKPNPKSKYEISNELIEIIRKYPEKIYILKHSSLMSELWSRIDLVTTVTGTVSIESIFDNKPVYMFGPGIQTKQKNCITYQENESLKSVIKSVKSGDFPKLTENEKIDFVQELMKTSFQGINSDGLLGKKMLNDSEIFSKLLLNYNKILNELQ